MTEPTAPRSTRNTVKVPLGLVCLIFFWSGVPALIYQLIWQRSLFSIYGINVESVTVIVAAFMLGLGLGSLAGGIVSRRRRVPLLLVFGLIELGIAIFGIGSLALFERVGSLTLGVSAGWTFLITFGLVLVPTLLMGATLPILVAFLIKRSGNVGRSVGILYFVNTLGSGVACFAGALFLFGALGQSGAVWFAAVLNLVVGGGAVLAHYRARAIRAERFAAGGEDSPAGLSSADAVPIRLSLALLLVAVCGFISLSYEILWFRAYAFVTGGLAASFALMLGAFLTGIAFGSLLARRFCPDVPLPRHLKALAGFIAVANVVSFLVVPGLAHTVTGMSFVWTLPLVVVAAAFLGAAFPLIAHLAILPGLQAGAKVSYLYVASIVGSSAGSLVTGFLLLDHLSLGQISLGLALFGLLTAGALLLAAAPTGRGKLLGSGGVALAGVLLIASSGPLFDQIYERLMYVGRFAPGNRFARIVEDKSGVITVTHDRHVYGGGMYDGIYNTDLFVDETLHRNMIERAYSIAAWHPSPRKALMIGLSTGSWAQVVAHHPDLEELTVVEISDGYTQLIREYPQVSSLLTNPKVTLVVDDGRRWLKRNPERRFDVIVMNTTYHWRAHCSNLLSVEFLELLRRHLLPGGAAIYNTTGSDRVQRTAATLFPDAMMVLNCVVVSESPIAVDRARWREKLLAWQIDGRPVIDRSEPRHIESLEALLNMSFEPRASILARTAGQEVVTDDNMGTEWSQLWAGR